MAAITYEELLSALEESRGIGNTPADAMTRDELEIELGLSGRAVLRRLSILKRNGRLGHCKKQSEAINGAPCMKDAYYLIKEND